MNLSFCLFTVRDLILPPFAACLYLSSYCIKGTSGPYFSLSSIKKLFRARHTNFDFFAGTGTYPGVNRPESISDHLLPFNAQVESEELYLHFFLRVCMVRFFCTGVALTMRMTVVGLRVSV
jgi:hypothetical protein